jgi:DNA gyrase subunit A
VTNHDPEEAAIASGANQLMRKCQERADLLDGLLKAISQRDAVQALIHTSESATAAQPRLMDLLTINQVQARAVLDMQWRRLTVADRRQLADEYERLTADIGEYESILASPVKQRDLAGTEQGRFLARNADPGGPPD